eukprot:TRINITY_DN15800_c0_g1_i1.p1 TRINITY_DN15800_c0_g1~~TRINITY_DN15800_c0_g1_i1.p1  ORF type:complete len:805 (+),score=259.16 TRINITY_DN15800_c0_g1_i1:117-2531(+)
MAPPVVPALRPVSQTSSTASLTQARDLSPVGASPPTRKLDSAAVDGLVSRLYRPEPLRQRTEEDIARKWANREQAYAAELDPHLRLWWARRMQPSGSPPRAATAPPPQQPKSRPAPRHPHTLPPPRLGGAGADAVVRSVLGSARCASADCPAAPEGGWRQCPPQTAAALQTAIVGFLDWGCLVSCAGVSTGWRQAALAQLRSRLQEQGHARAPTQRKALRLAAGLAAAQRRQQRPAAGQALVPLDGSASGAVSLPAAQAAADRSVVKRRDLTALRVLIDPPVHFQAMVYRLRLDISAYDLRWVPKATPDHVSALTAAGLLQTLGSVPLGPDEVAAWKERVQQKEARRKKQHSSDALDSPKRANSPLPVGESQRGQPQLSVRPGTIISSPRSALCLLRAGVDPHDLLPVELAQFRSTAGLEGAPPHIAVRRHRHHERMRQETLRQLRATYSEMCAKISLAQFVTLLQRLSPPGVEPVPESGADDDVEVSDTLRPPPTAYQAAATRRGREVRDQLRSCFRRADLAGAGSVTAAALLEAAEDDGELPRRERGPKGQARAAAARVMSVLRSYDPAQLVTLAEIEEAAFPTLDEEGGPPETKVDQLRRRHMERLHDSRERLEGNLIRTIRMQVDKMHKVELKRLRFEQHMRDFADERSREQQKRKEIAAKRADMSAKVVKENRVREGMRQRELIRRFAAEDERQSRLAAQRKLELQARREDFNLAARQRIAGIERRARADQWQKLCIVDKIRRKHDRAAQGERALRCLLKETTRVREKMLRECEATIGALRDPPPCISDMLSPGAAPEG